MFHVIDRSHVRLAVVSDEGRTGVIAILGPGEFFGERCLAGQPLYLSTASTMAPAETVRAEQALGKRMLADEPELSRIFICRPLAGDIRFESDLIDRLSNSSEKRRAFCCCSPASARRARWSPYFRRSARAS